MKNGIIVIIAFLGLLTNCFGQQNTWDKWNWLIGEWKGEGSGQPGQGGGTFSFNPGLNDKVLIRKSHSEYKSGENNPALVHDDLMIIYPDNNGSGEKAVYFDNEGHTIFYTISYSDKSIVLTSDKIPDLPTFRLVYTLIDDQTVNTRFEMSRNNEHFIPYIEGKSKKISISH